MSHVWISHITHMSESFHMYEWVMTHMWMIVTHTRNAWHGTSSTLCYTHKQGFHAGQTRPHAHKHTHTHTHKRKHTSHKHHTHTTHEHHTHKHVSQDKHTLDSDDTYWRESLEKFLETLTVNISVMLLVLVDVFNVRFPASFTLMGLLWLVGSIQ